VHRIENVRASRAPHFTADWTDGDLTDQERASRLKALNALLDLMRPSVQADGGDLVLIRADVETGVVEVQLQGACSSCAISRTHWPAA